MARLLSPRALLVRAAAAGATALALGTVCGVALVSDPAPAPQGGAAAGPALRVRAAAPPPRPVVAELGVDEAPPPAPVVDDAAPADPVELVRALPDARVMAQLAALLADPEPDVGTSVAEALAVAPSADARALLVAHLCRSADTPDLVHLACLEALAEIGQAADLEAVLPWARRADTAGVLGAWCVRTICARERVEVPADLGEVEAPTASRTDA